MENAADTKAMSRHAAAARAALLHQFSLAETPARVRSQVIKVFEDFNFSRVGQMQSLLEAHGIRTFIRNQYGSSVMGEVPFVEVVPQLFLLEERDVEQALELLKLGLPRAAEGADWVCRECDADVNANFNRCWKCGVGRFKG